MKVLSSKNRYFYRLVVTGSRVSQRQPVEISISRTVASQYLAFLLYYFCTVACLIPHINIIIENILILKRIVEWWTGEKCFKRCKVMFNIKSFEDKF